MVFVLSLVRGAVLANPKAFISFPHTLLERKVRTVFNAFGILRVQNEEYTLCLAFCSTASRPVLVVSVRLYWEKNDAIRVLTSPVYIEDLT